MAIITLFGTSTPTDGSAMTADELDREVYLPAAPATVDSVANTVTSFEGMNGWLEAVENLEVGDDVADTPPDNWQVKTKHLQRGAVSGGGMVGSTASIDFFNDFFRGLAKSKLNAIGGTKRIEPPNESYLPIPGAGCSFYLPHKCTALIFTWNISWVGDNECEHDGTNGAEDWSTVKFFIKPPVEHTGVPAQSGDAEDDQKLLADQFNGIGRTEHTINGTDVPAGLICRRRVDATRHSSSMQAASDEPDWMKRVYELFDAQRHREYSGHYTLYNAQPGYYSAGLFLASSGKQTRVRVRSMRYIYFK